MDIEHVFTNHTPNEAGITKIEQLRGAAKEMARMIERNCPDSSDRSTALYKLRECLFFANASIALVGKP